MRRRTAPLAAAAALATLLLAGCSWGAGSSDDSSVEGGGTAYDAPVEQVAPADEQVAPDLLVEAPEDRSVITTGFISITVEDPIESAASAIDLVTEAGGRVDSRTETPGTDTQDASATLVLRIPADELEPVVAELRELGEVNSVNMNASDVTQQRKDLDARITALSASVDRLLALLADADTTADLIAIESELSSRQAELDSLTQQRDWLEDQVDYSTITVDLLSEGIAPEPEPGDFWSGLVAGWNALLAFLSWIAVVAGVLLPWVGALLVIAAIVAGIVILATRRRHDRPDAAASAGADDADAAGIAAGRAGQGSPAADAGTGPDAGPRGGPAA